MQIDHIDRGLESLSIFPKEPHKKRQESDCRPGGGNGMNIAVDSLFSTSPSSSLSSLFGDSIGMESSVDILKDNDDPPYSSDHRRCSTSDRRYSSEKAERREFPPPIPSLARTENLQSRMPWVLRRHYTGDGRLILTEEKARRHEYFRAHRSNGRLTLHLVPLHVDNNAAEPADVSNQPELEDGHDHDHDRDGEEVDDHDRDRDGDEVEMDCLRYSEVSRRGGSRCVVNGVEVPAAIRPCSLLELRINDPNAQSM